MNSTIFKSLDGRYFCITDGKIIEIEGQQSKEHLTSAAAETVSVVNDKPQSQRDDRTETEVGLSKVPDSEKTTEACNGKDEDFTEKKIWRKQETLTLLELYKENIMDFDNKNTKPRKKCGRQCQKP